MPNSEEKRERDDLAAEYALGTLEESEARAAQALYDSDAGFAHETERWRERLALLDQATAPIAPPERLLPEILRRIGQSAVSNVTPILRLRRELVFWRGATAALTALAAALVIYVAVPSKPAAQPQTFVAVLQTNGKEPAFLAAIDVPHHVIAIRRVGAPPAEQHSYELWALGAGRKAPQSLGVVDAVARIPTDRLRKTGSGALRDTTFAISLEPQGGSPTGAPTGPVLFVGKLIATE